MYLDLQTLRQRELWQDYQLPCYDVDSARQKGIAHPQWIHFGAGNIFRAYIALLQQRLLNEGLSDRAMLAADTFDHDICDKIYAPHDNLSVAVMMHADGKLEKTVVASVAEAIPVGDGRGLDRLTEIFTDPELQMASFTITEKGYGLRTLSGEYQPNVAADLAEGPGAPRHAMSILCGCLLQRYHAGAAPIAMVSMDNCSQNGRKLREAVLEIAHGWQERGFVENDFIAYLEDPAKVSFPWSMIDKITPRPDADVAKALAADGLTEMEPIVTDRKSYVAPYVNAEVPQYLVIEDAFPNGRPALEKAGVYFTDRATVNRVETMKVTTCLNPLHTALAVYGCLLGYHLIADEMKDSELTRLVRHIGYDEGMPVVVDPGIIKPEQFIKEVLEERFPNAYIPDTPQRIATDTSQKVGVRYGETIKSYLADADKDVKTLTFIPLAIAGWCRYLLGVDDEGKAFELSPDPMLPSLQATLSGVKIGEPGTGRDALIPILSNKELFGSDLMEIGLGEKIGQMFCEMITGPGAIRKTLRTDLDAAER